MAQSLLTGNNNKIVANPDTQIEQAIRSKTRNRTGFRPKLPARKGVTDLKKGVNRPAQIARSMDLSTKALNLSRAFLYLLRIPVLLILAAKR